MRQLTAVVLLVLGGCASEATGPIKDTGANAPDDPGARMSDEIVVDLKDGTTQAQLDAFDKSVGIDLEFNSLEGRDDGIAVAHVSGNEDAVLAKLRGNPEVEVAEPMMTFTLPQGEEETIVDRLPPSSPGELKGFTPNDPDFAKQWNLRMIDMPKAWGVSRGKGVVVAVLDTGIAYEDYQEFRRVPDLAGVKFVKGYNFVDKTEHADDDHGHGTHVAGTIAQATNNGIGVAGIAFEASLMPVKVLNHFGSGTSADIADAIRFAADHGAQVINMSLGGGGHSLVMEKAVAYARKKGVTVVCAAGNAGRGVVEYPAAYPGAVAVAAVGPGGTKAFYSSWGKELDISAPGGDKSQGPEGGILQNTIDPRDPAKSVYAFYQGTSMATPHVAAVAALLYASGAQSPDEVEKALFAGAKQVGEKAWSEQYGHGILNAPASLAALGVGPGGINWNPLVWAAVLLVGVLLTIGRRARPGYFNILLAPSFAVPLLLATVGFFALRWFGGSSDAMVRTASLPIPDWERIIFGRGALANPLFYSAAIPIVCSIVAIGMKSIRPMIGGLAVGFAGFLAYAAWAKAPALSYLPFTFLARPWLVVNVLVCLFVARAMLRRKAA